MSSALPGFRLSLGLSLLFVSLIILLPMAALVMQVAHGSAEEIWRAVTRPRVMASYRVTVVTALIAALLNGVFGMLMAWILVRYTFPGRRLLDALMDLPFALPTAVAGLTLSALFAANGWVGSLLLPLGIRISYTEAGIVLAMLFTSIPFVVRTIQPVLEDMGPEYEEAAASLGASSWQTFWRVVLPVLFPAWAAGVSLSFVRNLGEFGAVIFIAGNMPFRTEVTSLMVFTRISEFEYHAAASIAVLVMVTSLLLLALIQWLLTPIIRRQRALA
jgi:sulfate/thiosulfate transport system permease protein